MLCPKCGTESSSIPTAFGIRRIRGQVACDVPSVRLKCRYLKRREIEVVFYFLLRFSAMSEQRICAIRRSSQYVSGVK
jgi:hypothetical protein